MALVKKKKTLKNEIYNLLKKKFNLKNCFIKVSYVEEDGNTQFHITVTVEGMNLNVRTCSSFKDEAIYDDLALVVIKDVTDSVDKAVREYVYRKENK